MTSILHFPGLIAILQDINAQRLDSVLQGIPPHSLHDSALERCVESLFQPSQYLAVYGTLAPGASNASEMEGINGVWQAGQVRGQRYDSGIAEATGYPGMVWDINASPNPIQLFHGKALS